MFDFRPFAAAVLMGLGLAAQPAAALTYVTYTGTTGPGVDYTGLFTAPSTDLSGYSFTAVLTIDPGVPGASFLIGGVDSAFASGTAIGSGTAIDATLTINGRSVTLSGNYLGLATRVDRFDPSFCPGCYDEVYHRVMFDDPVYNTRSELSFDTLGTHHNMVASPNAFGALDFTVLDTADRVASFNLAQYGVTGAVGGLLVDRITISDIAPVPEPGEWAMMLVGLTLVGSLARRRAAPETNA